MEIYPWVKSAHIIFVIALMAGLLIYPRYKIHQLSSRPGEPVTASVTAASRAIGNRSPTHDWYSAAIPSSMVIDG